jgi:CDP-paratose 2-epimerase
MRIFITGGAGFVGCNLAAHHLALGNHVTIFDNLSRPRTAHNLAWLRHQNTLHNQQPLLTYIGDIRHEDELRDAMSIAKPDLVVHLAAQVAVTTSVANPREDFEINALGTFNMLEVARSLETKPAVFFASTNKVYGGMEDVVVTEQDTRYTYRDFPNGIDEHQPLDFHSPYGCSKGTGDQYVRDYARIFGLKTVVFRQSTIYGTRQFGVEDQGWLAHFIIATVMGRPITIYGNGKQVRDMLHVSDLIRAYELAWQNIDSVSGEVFNVGGGNENTISIWRECGPMLEELAGRSIQVIHREWRPGDQPCFVSNNAKAQKLLGWQPKKELWTGIQELWQWVSANKDLFE